MHLFQKRRKLGNLCLRFIVYLFLNLFWFKLFLISITSAGFAIFMDFVLGMPPSSSGCRLAVGIYNATELMSDVKVLPLVNVAKEHNSKIPSGGVAVFGTMHPFPK